MTSTCCKGVGKGKAVHLGIAGVAYMFRSILGLRLGVPGSASLHRNLIPSFICCGAACVLILLDGCVLTSGKSIARSTKMNCLASCCWVSMRFVGKKFCHVLTSNKAAACLLHSRVTCCTSLLITMPQAAGPSLTHRCAACTGCVRRTTRCPSSP